MNSPERKMKNELSLRDCKMKLSQDLGVKGFPAGGTPPGGWLGLGAEEGCGKLR